MGKSALPVEHAGAVRRVLQWRCRRSTGSQLNAKASSCKAQSRYFRISQGCEASAEAASPPAQSPEAAGVSLGERIIVQTSEQLSAARQEQLKAVDVSQTLWDRASKTEISPWLEMTRWPSYLCGLSMVQVAPLASPPDPCTEPMLGLGVQLLPKRVVALLHIEGQLFSSRTYWLNQPKCAFNI